MATRHPQKFAQWIRLVPTLGLLGLSGLLGLAVWGLAGCQAGFVSSDSTAIPSAGAALKGAVHGGQQPVAGASIVLYATGSSGNGKGAVNLLLPHVVATDSFGNFTITGDYTCPGATTPVYLVARGGNPGLGGGTNNSALVMVAALGNCGNLSASTFITVNEVTTVAAAWALAQFTGAGAIVGASATNQAGLGNAFSVAANLANTATGRAASLPVGASSEPAKLYALANALAACVNSDGTTACQPLFTAATVSGTVPANTFDAALAIVRNPGANVGSVFTLGAASAPFQPTLGAAPHDWTMSLTYGNCTSGCGGLDLPGSVAIDANGNAWVANYFGAVVSEFSPAGAPVAANGFPGIGLRQSYGIAIDALDNVWVTNQEAVNGANHHYGSVSEFSSAGVELSGYGYTGGGLYYPQSVAADSNGNIWIADYGSSAASLLANNGSALSGSGGFAQSQLPFVSAVAVDANHNGWFAAQGSVSTVTSAGAVTTFSCCSEPAGIAIDQSGNVWVADYGGFSIVELSSAGAVLHTTSIASSPASPESLAVDGAGNVWTANYYGNSVTELQGSSAAALSPSAGFGRDAPLNEPYSVAVDASGNLWLSNSGGNTLTQMVGLASPVATPMLGPPTQP